MTIYECLYDVINRGEYNVSDMEHKIDLMFIEGKLTEEQKEELFALTATNANDAQQINIVEKLKELEDRIFSLEHPAEPTFPIWYKGYIANRGEILQWDQNNDGTIDYLIRYDGGRATTTSTPGQIEGWHTVDANGNITGNIDREGVHPIENATE